MSCKLTKTLEDIVYSKQKFEIYLEYNDKRHQKEITKEGFTDFLCSSTLISHQPILSLDPLIPTSYGTKHLVTLMDCEIFCVSVLDLLPNYLVSSYVFFNIKFAHFSPGLVSVLLEMKYAKRLKASVPMLKYFSLDCFLENNKKIDNKKQYQSIDRNSVCLMEGMAVPRRYKRK